MILAIDIGNSTIGYAFLKGGGLERVSKMESMPESDLFLPKIENFLETVSERYKIEKVIICSVVPDSLRILQRKIKKILGLKPLVVGRGVRIPIVNKYQHPRQVGKDRLLCAFAARELYGAPAIVIDLGTAITFDGISSKGEYLGGAIVPGLRLSAEALFQKTALLPRVHMVAPGRVIGRNTEESIQSGLFHGFGALCDGMIERLSEEMRCDPKVIMTGGYAEVLNRFMKHPVAAVDEGLIFKGIGLLAG